MIKLENVTKTFNTGESALADINLLIEKGEYVFVSGASGSGKTTLFRLLTRELLPTSGTIHVNDVNITKLPKGKVPYLRRKIGVIFQDLKLLMDRTILENIMLPLQIADLDSKKARERANEVLEQVGIAKHKLKFPVQLSGGELQRVAIARAIVFTPDIVIADEPTGNLDASTSWEIVKILQEINKTGTTILMATHNNDIVKSMAKRELVLEKGNIVKDTGVKVKEEKPEKVLEEEQSEHKKHREHKEHKEHKEYDKNHKKEDK